MTQSVVISKNVATVPQNSVHQHCSQVEGGVQLQEPLVQTAQNTAQQLHFIEKSQRQRTSEVWTTIKLVKPQQLKIDELVKALGEQRVLLEQS